MGFGDAREMFGSGRGGRLPRTGILGESLFWVEFLVLGAAVRYSSDSARRALAMVARAGARLGGARAGGRGVAGAVVCSAGLLRERMDYVPGGSGAEPMRFSPSDGYQIGGERGADGLITGDDYAAFINDFVASIANGATDLNNNGVVDGRDFAAWNAEWDSGAAVGRAVLSAADGLDAKGPGNVRGRSADAGVALDAQLSGKVTGADGVTGRVNYVPRPANMDVAPGGGGPRRPPVQPPDPPLTPAEMPIGELCVIFSATIDECLACCVFRNNGAEATWLPCAESCFDRFGPRAPSVPTTPRDSPRPPRPPKPAGGGLPWIPEGFGPPDYDCDWFMANFVAYWRKTIDPNDKYTHCYASCRISQVCSRVFTGLMGTIREHYQSQPDSNTDILANEHGIYLAGHECPDTGYLDLNRDCCRHLCDARYPSPPGRWRLRHPY